jgi:hypothetical protein
MSTKCKRGRNNFPATIGAGRVPIRNESFRITLNDVALPVDIDMTMQFHTADNKPVSYTTVRQIGDNHVTIISTDFTFADTSQYHYFFSQKKKDRFFRSKREVIEIESTMAKQEMSGLTGSCLYRFENSSIYANPSKASLKMHLAELRDIPRMTDAVHDREIHSTRPGIHVLELTHNPPWSLLTVFFVPLSTGLRPLCAKLAGEEIDERRYEFLAVSRDRICHTVDVYRHDGWQARTYFFRP